MCELSSSSISEINHIQELSLDFKNLLESGDFVDVVVVVEGHRFSCHKAILASRSNYFKALFFNGMKESQSSSEIELHGINSHAFRQLLTYTYSGRLDLAVCSQDEVIDLLSTAHQYCFTVFQDAICKYLISILDSSNVCVIFELARLYNINVLHQHCRQFADANAESTIESEGFLTLSKESVVELLSRDSFCTREITIFNAISRWLDTNPNVDKNEVMPCVRLSLIDRRDLLQVVRKSNLISPDVILDTIEDVDVNDSTISKPRGFLVQEENVATAQLGATVVSGGQCNILVSGIASTYDMEYGFAHHHIDKEDNDGGILVALGREYIINMIRMLLWDKDNRSYSYFIEVSNDKVAWKRITDRRNYLCRSWQYLLFPSTVVKYIRIVGTRNSANSTFHLVGFECYLSKESWPVTDTLGDCMIPNTNIATREMGATILQGIRRSNEQFLSGSVLKDYDWESGYICHQIHPNCQGIIVQLGQPYVIDSLRLLLWDLDDRQYNYYIEVSINREDWICVVDKKTDSCQSWQHVTFDPTPVSFIRIIGTKNSANDVFHCVYFECPAASADKLSTATNQAD